MRTTKRLLSIFLVCALCFCLSACGISKEDAVGTWSGTYEYNGNMFAVAFVLDAGGDYAEVTYKNGTLSSVEEGTWEIDGGKVVLHKDGNTGISVVYSYKGGALVNNKHEFYKG